MADCILVLLEQAMSLSPTSYRDRIYMVEDIILKLVEHGQLNQTSLISFCGLNLKKHRCILDELEVNGFIQKGHSPLGKRMVTVYRPTQKGVEFCRSILEPYERMFPRTKDTVIISKEKDEPYVIKKTDDHPLLPAEHVNAVHKTN
jgi:predicted transcriptional regulator